MAQPPADSNPPKSAPPAKGSVAARVSINRRLEAGDELFDRVLGRLELNERRRRRRRRALYALLWLCILGLIAAGVHFGGKAIPTLNLPFGPAEAPQPNQGEPPAETEPGDDETRPPF